MQRSSASEIGGTRDLSALSARVCQVTRSSTRSGDSPRKRARPRSKAAGKTSSAAGRDTPQPDGRDTGIPFEEIQPSVLLVDDHVAFCVGMCSVLNTNGLDTTYATSAIQAQGYLRMSAYDVAVLDWKLGRGSDGLDLLSDIRDEGFTLPIVFATLFDEDDIEVRARCAGADAYVPKDDTQQLCNVVRDLIGQFRSKGPWLALREILSRRGLTVSGLSKYTRRAIGRMCTGLRQHLDIRVLAKVAGDVTEGHFTRVFHQDTGLSPAGFLAELRVETAIPLLRDTGVSQTEIAKQVGFGGLKNMRRNFKVHVGKLPRDFRADERHGQ